MGRRRREEQLSPEELRQRATERVLKALREDMAATPCFVPLDNERARVRYRARLAALLRRQAEETD